MEYKYKAAAEVKSKKKKKKKMGEGEGNFYKNYYTITFNNNGEEASFSSFLYLFHSFFFVFSSYTLFVFLTVVQRWCNFFHVFSRRHSYFHSSVDQFKKISLSSWRFFCFFFFSFNNLYTLSVTCFLT